MGIFYPWLNFSEIKCSKIILARFKKCLNFNSWCFPVFFINLVLIDPTFLVYLFLKHFDFFRYNVSDPKNASNDRFILSKGHAAPILYAAWAEAGLFPTSDLVRVEPKCLKKKQTKNILSFLFRSSKLFLYQPLLFPTHFQMKLRTLESDLEGHPTPRLNFVDVATGSLGQGLSVACGMAYCGKFIDKASYRFLNYFLKRMYY
jgi:transketolase N-terminal domain/subunit